MAAVANDILGLVARQAATSASSAINESEGNGGGSGAGGASSPLLFFVALGFGVVFTNLWIIVGTASPLPSKTCLARTAAVARRS
ncbi:hypothetical protein HYQ46_003275 [Verticillium longisporum]|nr:hypothetical protein HYQ46_003275 [Verticillium longisporum]